VAPVTRLCACGCGRPVPRQRAAYFNRAHMLAHWAHGTAKAEIARRNVPAARRTKRLAAFRKALEVTGLSLTDRELTLYKRAYARGYAAGHMRGKDHGYRKGWAEACGERRAGYRAGFEAGAGRVRRAA
jgi:hypothetical protein